MEYQSDPRQVGVKNFELDGFANKTTTTNTHWLKRDAKIKFVGSGIDLEFSGLTDKQIAAVAMIYFAGITKRRTAKIIGVSPSHVSKYISRALKTLKKEIVEKKGKNCDAEGRTLPIGILYVPFERSFPYRVQIWRGKGYFVGKFRSLGVANKALIAARAVSPDSGESLMREAFQKIQSRLRTEEISDLPAGVRYDAKVCPFKPWYAYAKFKQKSYNLGEFSHLDIALEARKTFDKDRPFLEKKSHVEIMEYAKSLRAKFRKGAKISFGQSGRR